MTSRTILIGLDGATFTILEPLMDQGIMPFLKRFVKAGARAELHSVIPPLTPPAWTSLMTGRSPGHHGIFDFFQLESAGSQKIRLATSNDVGCDTIWHIANRYGLRTTVLNFPLMFPPPAVEGNVIAGWMPWRQLRLGCRPDDLYDRLKALPDFNARELAMDMEMEAKATEGCREDEYEAWIELHIRREKQWLTVLRYLMDYDPTPLTAILFDGPDKVQHLLWRYLDPALWPADPTPDEQKIHDLCLEYFRQLDQLLAEIAAMAGPETTIVIASDHGFGATTEVLHINTLLEQAGYLKWSDKYAFVGGKPGILGMGHLARHTQWLDWERTTAYVSTPTGNGIHILQATEDGQPGVSPSHYEQFRAELISALSELVDPATGEAVITRIWTREEVFKGPAMTLAPDLTLTLRDGGLVSILPSDVPLKPRPIPAGTHRPNGIFMMGGPGIRPGISLRDQSILNVTPILLYSLALPIPDDLEGRVPLEMFEPAFRAQRPIEIVSGMGDKGQQESASTVETLYDEEAEALILNRLRDLGYID